MPVKEYKKEPIPPGLDIGELARVLGELQRELKGLRHDFDDYARQTHGGIDQSARDDIAVLQSSLTALTSRVSVTETDIDALQAAPPPHQHSWTGTDITNKPTTFAPESHGMGAHDTSVASATDLSNLQNEHDNHEHTFGYTNYPPETVSGWDHYHIANSASGTTNGPS